MLFIFSTPVLIRHLWQLKTIVFLHRCLLRLSYLPWPHSTNSNDPICVSMHKEDKQVKVRLHWRDFVRDFALACTFSKENK